MNKILSRLQLLSEHLRTSRVLLRQRLQQVNRQFSLLVILFVIICVLTFPLAFKPTPKTDITPSVEVPTEETSEVETDTEAESEAITEPEQVHEDLGDEPVEPQAELSIDEVEKRAALGELTVTTRTMQKGDSLLGILSEQKISASEKMAIVEALEVLLDLKSLRPGLTFLFFNEKDGTLVGVTVTQKQNETLSVLREKDGTWTTFSQTGRVETRQEHTQVVIEKTFSGSAQKAGISQNIVNQIISALDGEFDFTSDAKPGNVIDIITETKVTQSGLEIGTKQLLYIGLKTGSKEIHKYAYGNAFYDAKGRTAEKAIMKRPLKARPRLSSPFGKRRHPILQYEIYHKGVDLAVPKNTPVVAAADGTIEIIGRKGSYGKYIRLGHKGGYQTAYAHLNGYRQDLKVGSRVKRGEVIAYVGTTGRSTGPHLHFEVIKNGKVVDPFGTNKISSAQLSGFELEKFQSWAESINPDFKMHLIGKIPGVPMRKPF